MQSMLVEGGGDNGGDSSISPNTCSGGSSSSSNQKQQRQRNFNPDGDTIRDKTKVTKNKLMIYLFYIPLIIIVLCMQSLIFFTKFNGDNNGESMTMTLKREDKEQRLQQEEHQQKLQPASSSSDLPKWIIDYVKWHQFQRKKYPGGKLFTTTDPEAPKLLVRTCLGLCGGLHDRLGQLPFDIYLASKLNRVLLIAWSRPRSLENFLIPPIPIIQDENNENENESSNDHQPLYLDWTIPGSQKFSFNFMERVKSDVIQLFEGYSEDHPGENNFWDIGFHQALKRAGALNIVTTNATQQQKIESKYSDAKILRHRILGHLDEKVLEKLLLEEGYYSKDDLSHTPQQLHDTPTFGNVWKLFFRPSPAVRKEIISSLKEMDLLLPDYTNKNHNHDHLDLVDPISLLPTSSQMKNFTAVHCRVRHPKAHPKGKTTMGKDNKAPADKTGLPWYSGGPQRQFALEIATSAIQCAIDVNGVNIDSNSNNKQPQPPPPIYFLSDSNDLVKHVSIELYDETPGGYLETNKNNISSIYPPLFDIVHHHHNSDGSSKKNNNHQHLVRARNVTLENTHIDRQKGREPYAYYATFVDLYLAMNANCVIYGVGYYAAFAAKISGVACKYVYAEESWGSYKEKNAQICPNTDFT
jgi:hypothetical protein